MTARSFISSPRNCRRFLAATHHAAILNNYSHDLQVLHFTVERGINCLCRAIMEPEKCSVFRIGILDRATFIASPNQAIRVAQNRVTRSDGPGYHAARSDGCIVSDRHAGKDDRTTIDPDASADRDRVGNLETLGTQGPVFGVFSAPELDCGALQCSAADLCKILRT